jgi:hypothetical protein
VIDLHKNCKNRLIDRLAEEMNYIQIEKGIFLIFNTCSGLYDMEKSLPNDTKLKEKTENYIGDNPLFEFCYHSIRNIVIQQTTYDENRPPYTLSTLPYFQNTREAAERIINDFVSLPQKYVVIFKLNEQLSSSFKKFYPRTMRGRDDYFRSEDIKLSILTQELRDTFPERKGAHGPLSFIFDFFEWEEEKVYLIINLEGFISESGTTMPLHQCKSDLKAFVGLALACHIVEKGRGILQGIVGTLFPSQPTRTGCATGVALPWPTRAQALSWTPKHVARRQGHGNQPGTVERLGRQGEISQAVHQSERVHVGAQNRINARLVTALLPKPESGDTPPGPPAPDGYNFYSARSRLGKLRREFIPA